jgi:hypothetical protein
MSRVHRFLVGLALVAVTVLLLAVDSSGSDGGQKTPIVVRVERGGFRWSDAAVGALAGVGISLAVTGCLALVRLGDAGSPSSTKGDQQ